jgi:hypothetical protein
MEKINTVTGSGPVFVDSEDAGHCAYEINVYRDQRGRVTGHGHVMADSLVLGRIARGQHIEVASGDKTHRFALTAGPWQPGERRMDVETGADVLH